METPLDAEKQAFRIAAMKVRIEANKQTPNAGNIIAVSYTHLRAPRDGLLSRMPSSA